VTLQLAPPRFPSPPDRFDRENEAQFRRALERALLDIQQGAASSASSATTGGTLLASWKFDTTTTAADPGLKKFRANNATLGSVTALYFNDTTNGGFDISTIAGILAAGNRIYVQQASDATRAALFEISGAPTDNTGWWTVPVTVVDSGATLYQNAAECAVVFLLTVGSSGAARGTDALTTASIADLVETTGVWDIGYSTALLMSLQANKACRVRLYTTAAARTSDSGRGLGTDPTAGTGVLCEYVFASASTLGGEPPVILRNGDGTPTNEVYYAIQNRSGSTGTVTVTATLLAMEA